MNATLPDAARRGLDVWADRYRRRGYEAVILPEQDDLPFDLLGYRPDLLVRKPGANLLLEIKARADRVSLDSLSAAAREIRRHPGWDFVLVTDDDLETAGLPGDEQEAFAEEDAVRRLAHAERLTALGEHEAAFLTVWIALERLLRAAARRAAVPVERLSPNIAVRQLYSLGEISAEKYDTTLECLAVRNRVVHGMPVEKLPDAVARLAGLVQGLLAEWAEPI